MSWLKRSTCKFQVAYLSPAPGFDRCYVYQKSFSAEGEVSSLENFGRVGFSRKKCLSHLLLLCLSLWIPKLALRQQDHKRKHCRTKWLKSTTMALNSPAVSPSTTGPCAEDPRLWSVWGFSKIGLDRRCIKKKIKCPTCLAQGSILLQNSSKIPSIHTKQKMATELWFFLKCALESSFYTQEITRELNQPPQGVWFCFMDWLELTWNYEEIVLYNAAAASPPSTSLFYQND